MSEGTTDAWPILKQLVDDLARALGDRWEVVLHDFNNPESSIVAIANGHISGREVGGGTSNLGLPMFRNPDTAHSIFHYQTRNRAGSPMKSSSIVIRDGTGKPMAALCLNWDMEPMALAAQELQRMVAIENPEVNEVLGPDINDVLRQTISDAVATMRKPIPSLSRQDKQRIVETLEEKGFFLVKGSVNLLAASLGISRATVYGYLSEVRASRMQRVL